jgi:hypothetical protein
MFLSWWLRPANLVKRTSFSGRQEKSEVFSGPALPLILTFSPAAKKAAKAKGKETARSKERLHSTNSSPQNRAAILGRGRVRGLNPPAVMLLSWLLRPLPKKISQIFGEARKMPAYLARLGCPSS